jgi:hypothetical protein
MEQNHRRYPPIPPPRLEPLPNPLDLSSAQAHPGGRRGARVPSRCRRAERVCFNLLYQKSNK